MTVAELIEKLKGYESDLEVLFEPSWGQFYPVTDVRVQNGITERETDKEISAVVLD